MIKAVYFDLDDTLYDQLDSFALALEAAGLSQQAAGKEVAQRLYSSLRRHSDRLWAQHVRGELTLAELRIARGVAAFADAGIALAKEQALLLQQCYEREQGRLRLRPEVLPLMAKLRERGMATGLITNGPVDHQMGKIKALGLHELIQPERIYISDGIGYAKPDQRVFHHVRQQEGLLPEELLYVGDAWHNDIAPSYRAGWTPIWLNAREHKPDDGDSEVRYKECRTLSEASAAVLACCMPQE